MQKNKTTGLQAFVATLVVSATAIGQSPYRSEGPSLDELPAVGHRYHTLTPAERNALRPTFRLPMRALFEVDGAAQLLSAVVTEPLPDPDKPLLPVAGDQRAVGDPFGEEGVTVGRDALGALGELFALEAELLRASGKPAPTSRRAAAVADTTYESQPKQDPPTQAAVEEDPFASSDDPDDDPFGF